MTQNKIFEGLRPQDSEYLLGGGDSGSWVSATVFYEGDAAVAFFQVRKLPRVTQQGATSSEGRGQMWACWRLDTLLGGGAQPQPPLPFPRGLGPGCGKQCLCPAEVEGEPGHSGLAVARAQRG